MARYDYKCSSCGNVFEVEHPMSETPEVVCPNCGAPVTRLGSKFCEYCGSGLREISVRVWSINKIAEIL